MKQLIVDLNHLA